MCGFSVPECSAHETLHIGVTVNPHGRIALSTYMNIGWVVKLLLHSIYMFSIIICCMSFVNSGKMNRLPNGLSSSHTIKSLKYHPVCWMSVRRAWEIAVTKDSHECTWERSTRSLEKQEEDGRLHVCEIETDKETHYGITDVISG